jgi:hypothetical protein
MRLFWSLQWEWILHWKQEKKYKFLYRSAS